MRLNESSLVSPTWLVKLLTSAAGLLVLAHLTTAAILKLYEVKRPVEDPFYGGLPVQFAAEHRQRDRSVFNEQEGVAPLSLVIPCQSEDFIYIPMLLESLANQTVAPKSTHLILNIPPQAANGSVLPLLSDFDFARGTWTHEMLDDLIVTQQRNHPNRTANAAEAKAYLLATRIPVRVSLQKIHNLTIHVRSGVHYAGDNRMYGANMTLLADDSDDALIGFFDCDDYLHPQRTAFLHKTFTLNPDLEALVHGFQLIPMTQWDKDFPKFMSPRQYMPNDKSFLWSYEMMHENLPVNDYANETNGEPKQAKGSLWFFPKNMRLPPHTGYSIAGHNGWLTIKKKVLYDVPYPQNLSRGQDSLYNYRLIRAKKNWNMLPIPLAAYVRAR